LNKKSIFTSPANGKEFPFFCLIFSINLGNDVPPIGFWGRAVGADIRLLDYLVTSDGFRLPRPKFFKDLESELKLLQKRLARKKKRSKNYEKARKKIEKLHLSRVNF
jgi:putative transposase